jgi:hypothetical protein
MMKTLHLAEQVGKEGGREGGEGGREAVVKRSL